MGNIRPCRRISPFRDHEHRLTEQLGTLPLGTGGAHPGSGVPPSRSRRGSPSRPCDDPGQYETVDTESPVVGPHRGQVLGDQGLVERPTVTGRTDFAEGIEVERRPVVTRQFLLELGHFWLGLPEDGVGPQAPPAHGRPLPALLVGDCCPLPGGPSVWATEAPGHLGHTWSVGNRLHPQAGRPLRRALRPDEALTGIIERPDGGPEHLALVVVQATVVSLERLCPLEPHESRSSSSSSTSWAIATRPAPSIIREPK